MKGGHEMALGGGAPNGVGGAPNEAEGAAPNGLGGAKGVGGRQMNRGGGAKGVGGAPNGVRWGAPRRKISICTLLPPRS